MSRALDGKSPKYLDGCLSSAAVRPPAHRVASPAVGVKEIASIDGHLAPVADATVPLKDDGLYRGDGVFELIRLYDGYPFALADHLDRLERSASAIELP